ncbi:hypothetical protein V6N11_021611 [Hibiscus sabdariffa]|uniref:Uncharacterized protein n=1 Tax=Hibiscus sabdariffa TaxID=183260 RepID=A0ABR2PBT5_9ROSI
MVELRSTPVEEGADPKTIDDIMDEVLVLQTQMDAMRSALLAVGIQVPPLQFPDPNNTSNSSSSGSQPT